RRFIMGYVGAVSTSMGLGLLLNKCLGRLVTPNAGAFFRTLIPFPAVMGGNIASVLLMRWHELSAGVAVKSPTGNTQESIQSKEAAKRAVKDTIITRIILPIPVLLLPPLLHRGVLVRFLPTAGLPGTRANIIGMSVLSILCFAFALPAAVAMFPQEGTMRVDELEEEAREKALSLWGASGITPSSTVYIMGNRHNDRRLCLPPSTTIPEGIAVEGVSSGGIANRPRRSTIGMRVVEDNHKLTPTDVVPQDRLSDSPEETVKVDAPIGSQLDGSNQREVGGKSAELDHLSADGRYEHDDMPLAVEHIASPVPIPSTTTTLLRAYGGIGLLGEIVDRLWSRSLTDPRLRMRLLAYQSHTGDAHDDQRPPSIVRKAWMHILAHSLLATTPSEGSQYLTYLLLPPLISLSYDTAAFAILPTTEYHLSALLENFAMVSQDIVVTVNDNQPTNKDIAKAIRAIIDTSTPLIISSPPSSRSGSTIDPFDAPLHQNGSEGLCDEGSCTTCCLYTATATPSLAVCSPLLSLCLTPTIITQHPIECGHDAPNQQRHHRSTTSTSLLALLGGVEGITRLVNRTVELIGADTRIRAYYI
ncbi:Sideroflexin-5, partial [Perkinsus olseni]